MINDVITSIVNFLQEKGYEVSTGYKDYCTLKSEIAVIPVKRSPKNREWFFTVHVLAHCDDLEALDALLSDLEEIDPLDFEGLRIDSGIETEFFQERSNEGYIIKNVVTCVLPCEECTGGE